MENGCANCECEFRVKPSGKGYYRFSLENYIPYYEVTAREALEELTSMVFTPIESKRKGKFLCANCFTLLGNGYRYQKTVQEFWNITAKSGYIGQQMTCKQEADSGEIHCEPSTSTPKETVEERRKNLIQGTKQKIGIHSKWDSVIAAIRARKYRVAISRLYRASPGSKRQFIKVVKNLVRKEIKALLSSKCLLCTDATLPNIEAFSWDRVLDDVKEMCPLLEGALHATITFKKNESALSRGNKSVVDLKPMLGQVFACLLHARSPRKAKFLQTIVSVQLWRGGLKRETLQQLSRTGICLGSGATISAIDSFKEDFGNVALSNKEELQRHLKSNAPLHPGFTTCWDNVGKKVKTRHQTAETKAKYINFALAYLFMNRIPSTHLEWRYSETVPATEIPLASFIPSAEDFHEVRQRMCVIVSRILTVHLPWFKEHMSDCPVRHLLHEHSLETSQKSVVVNLGLFEENPSTTQGAIAIYERLQKYVPHVLNEPYPMVVYGDEMSCEQGVSAHRARQHGLDSWQRLDRMEPCTQEFHKEMLLLQDFYDEFYKLNHVDRGTIFHIRNLCNFRSVKADISDNFSEAWELMCIFVEGYTALMAMNLVGMETSSDRPSTAPVDIETRPLDERKAFLDDAAERIVEEIWHTTNTQSFLDTEGGGQKEKGLFCCTDEDDDDIVGCGSRNACINGQYFHRKCVEIQNADDWYCSPECQKNSNPEYQYCHCETALGDEVPMISCSAEAKCLYKEWYHWPCLNLTEETVPPVEDDWYCSKRCEEIAGMKRRRKEGKRRTRPSENTGDYKYAYTRAAMWRGLNLMCRRDAVREGDGEVMMSHWIIDLLHFFKKCHHRYVSLAHRQIASVKGWLPEKLREDIIWNRTINYSGGLGSNLPADLMNEVFSRRFKELFKDAKDHYTSTALVRCSQMVGPLGEAIDNVVDSKGMESEIYRHRRDINRNVYVARMVNFLKNEKLVQRGASRHHASFQKFSYEEDLKSPTSFIAKMKDLSLILDNVVCVNVHDLVC